MGRSSSSPSIGSSSGFMVSFSSHPSGIVVDLFTAWRASCEPRWAQSRRGNLGDGPSGAGRIVTKAPSPCASATLNTNATCGYHLWEFGTNPARRGGRSGVVSPWPDCDERRNIASKRHHGGAGLQRECASTSVCDTARRLQHANGTEVRFFPRREWWPGFARGRGSDSFD